MTDAELLARVRAILSEIDGTHIRHADSRNDTAINHSEPLDALARRVMDKAHEAKRAEGLMQSMTDVWCGR